MNPISWRAGVILIACATLAACGKKPIEEAVQANDRNAVSEALSKGADVNAKLSGGDTPLLVAAKAGQSSSAQGLIEGGADIRAAATGMTGICNLLVDRGMPIDEKGPGGVTPLMLAITKARQETAKFLVRHGASLDAKDDSGANAIDYATRAGDPRFANDLKLAAQMRSTK